MTDTIDDDVIRKVAGSIFENIRPGEDVIVHTLTVTLNGAHGGVDVIADIQVGPELADRKYSWRVS
jgi:O-acetyl-ADP-ribose deacetylase (regulator of RNase III)